LRGRRKGKHKEGPEIEVKGRTGEAGGLEKNGTEGETRGTRSLGGGGGGGGGGEGRGGRGGKKQFYSGGTKQGKGER